MTDQADELPEEVVKHVKEYFLHTLTDEGKWVDLPFDPTRIVYAAKTDTWRGGTWAKALKTGIAAWGDKKNGWRKCHTKNYWVYYALELAEDSACPETGHGIK